MDHRCSHLMGSSSKRSDILDRGSILPEGEPAASSVKSEEEEEEKEGDRDPRYSSCSSSLVCLSICFQN